MDLAVVLGIALAQAMTLVALDGHGSITSHSPDPSLDTSNLDGHGCSASPSPYPSLGTSRPRWPWL